MEPSATPAAGGTPGTARLVLTAARRAASQPPAATVLQHGQSAPPWQCSGSAPAPPQGAPVWAARHSQGAPRPLGPQLRPQLLELATSKVADYTAFDHLGITYLAANGWCYLRHQIDFGSCITALGYDSYRLPPLVSSPQASSIPPPSPPSPSPQKCGISSCTATVLATSAGGSLCEGRIDWLVANRGATELAACQLVGEEFPPECGPCAPQGIAPLPLPPPSLPAGSGAAVELEVVSYNLYWWNVQAKLFGMPMTISVQAVSPCVQAVSPCVQAVSARVQAVAPCVQANDRWQLLYSAIQGQSFDLIGFQECEDVGRENLVKVPLGSASVYSLCLLRACLASVGSSVLPE